MYVCVCVFFCLDVVAYSNSNNTAQHTGVEFRVGGSNHPAVSQGTFAYILLYFFLFFGELYFVVFVCTKKITT